MTHSGTETAAAEAREVSVGSGRPDGGKGRAWASDAGMATAEYAIATLAACGFAGLLVAILRGGEVRGLLLGIVQRALSLA